MHDVVLTDVSKQFMDNWAVRDLSFEVSKGSVFGLVGPNGAGKTTTIRMIMNFFAPDAGTVEVLGQMPSASLQRRIGYMPEERGLYKGMTVAEQLLFFARLKGIKKGNAQGPMREWLSRFELSKWEKSKSTELSKGMQQKIQFIATVLHDPQILILDEPFTGLDPVSVSVLKDALMTLKSRGKTVIFSSHQMEQVEQMCDVICLMKKGKKLLGGTLSEIKRGYGKNIVLLDCAGADSCLTSDLAHQIERYPTHVQIRLRDGANPQDIIKRIIESGAPVNRFEIVEPSLNEIFIENITRNSSNGNDDQA